MKSDLLTSLSTKGGSSSIVRRQAQEVATLVLKGDVSVEDIWKLDARKRGVVVEEVLAKSDYKHWWNVGAAQNGFFEMVDFQAGNTLASLKTSSANYDGWFYKLAPDIRDLVRGGGPKVDGEYARKLFDVRIPKGTMNTVLGQQGKKYLEEMCDLYKITLKVEEF